MALIHSLIRKFRRKGAASAAVPAPLTPDLERTIRNSFEAAAADEEHFPSTIDPRIEHVRLLVREFSSFTGPLIADIGSGKGRFARVLADEIPGARLACSDVSLNMLAHVRPPLSACAASMIALPFRDGGFDAAYATESLEHAVDISAAVAEICRIVRPGGRIVIIDKNKEHWGKLKTPEWERWFTRAELEQLLSRHCRSVRSQYISYWEDVEPDGMFLAWVAER
ncbi:MAG: methyltransferase domain-containing protein [Acidobacteriota bacterium]